MTKYLNVENKKGLSKKTQILTIVNRKGYNNSEWSIPVKKTKKVRSDQWTIINFENISKSRPSLILSKVFNYLKSKL